MKNLALHILLAATFMVSSCNILDIEPTTSWTSTNIPTEESHLQGILYAGYGRLQSALRINFLVYGEMRSEVFYNNAFNVNIDKVIANRLDNGMSLASWRTFYEAIKQANVVIKFTPELLKDGIVTETSANAIMGQAYALRAYTYFYLVRIWGDVPLVIEPFLSYNDLRDFGREPQERVFQQIHLDLQEAVRLIPVSATSRTTFTQAAAYAIDAHVFAWEHNYEKVIEQVDHVLNNTNYALTSLYSPSISVNDNDFKEKVQSSEFAKIFNEGRSKESIFELAFSMDDGDDNQYLSSYLSGSFPTVRPNVEYAETFDDADWRAVVAHELASNGLYKVVKFTIGFNSDVDTRNIVLLRLADLYLLKAEAIVNLRDTDDDRKDAMDLVNRIRNRAGGPDFEIPETEFLDRNVFTQEYLKGMILEERKFELSYEGHRWFDLIRSGKAVEIVRERAGIEIHPMSLVWPIHIEEVRRGTGVEQNEYYK